MNDIKQIENQVKEVDRLQENTLPKIKALHDDIESLEQERSVELVKVALGETTNGMVQKLTKAIADRQRDLEDTQKLADGLRARKADLLLQERAIKLGLKQVEYRNVAPEVKKLVEKYMTMREGLREVVSEYNEKHRRAGSLRNSIQALRRDLNVGQMDLGDLPALRNLNWNDQQTFISRGQLMGEKQW
jgi:uncharacterized protein involved in exopolysaccharide biosynthesis